ncbi:seryl-tRNA synthetase [Rhizoclosmatium globosum]|uniref:serine--tRNA ligase n=1 Tax=Rhizoclosmatium globosum TaxID=329046 RepID=A0A1Y2BN69_9FUNG|nr:seryl-tRNA synthetase [Rhizoclosmatium globosum]|eukprot:ORY36204.1 seryl-tRNA synthetase [Rhizoclosmatium globosum]
MKPSPSTNQLVRMSNVIIQQSTTTASTTRYRLKTTSTRGTLNAGPLKGSLNQPTNQQQQQSNQSRSFLPHLDYKSLKAKTLSGSLPSNIKLRNIANTDPFSVVALYDKRVSADFDLAELRKLRNKIAADVKALAKQKTSNQNSDAFQTLQQRGRALKQEIAEKEHALSQLDLNLYDEARHLPNDTCPSVPIGDESKAEVLDIINKHKIPPPPTPETLDSIKNHVDLCSLHDMADFTRASKVSGSGFYFLKNFGALFELALQRYAIETLTLHHGFTPVTVPDIIRHEVLEACGFSPRAGVQDPQTYFLNTHLDPSQHQHHTNTTNAAAFDPMRLCLAATAEFPLAAMHAGEVLKPSELPIKYVGLGRAFRAEGLAGSINRGLYRVHQFSKVEMFGLVAGGSGKEALERSEAMMEEFKSIQQSLFEGLEICFRILNMPTEELGAPAYKKYDMEAWMPGKNAWGEISSTSNCTDYQSRRLNIRNFPQSQSTDSPSGGGEATTTNLDFVHTINGTAAAIPRLLIALVETHQNSKGDVYVPLALRPFLLGGKVDVIKAGESFGDVMKRIR